MQTGAHRRSAGFGSRCLLGSALNKPTVKILPLIKPNGDMAPSRLLTVRHVTVYQYCEPVTLGEHRVMFRPRESHDLRLIQTNLAIQPQPVDLHWVHDIFDNSVAVASFGNNTTTTELRFESVVTLEHVESARPEYRLESDAIYYPLQYSDEERIDLAQSLTQRHPSFMLEQWAHDFLNWRGSGETMSLLRMITTAIYENFGYRQRAERGIQMPHETLHRGQGTCRDFALLMIEAVRCLGFAARFVSGYIFVPEVGPYQYAGGGATHAWLQVYLPGAGWVDFDPTNKIVGNRNLIRVAVAWDHAQVLPLWGTFLGRSYSCTGMDVSVSVSEQIAYSG